MKKALRKDFFMDIKKSFARFISIFFIVALGVAFFSGIQAASPDMRYSGDSYYDETNLMDLRVMGTLGLTDEDLEALNQVKGVELAEGGYALDVLSGEKGSQQVIHLESLGGSRRKKESVSLTASWPDRELFRWAVRWCSRQKTMRTVFLNRNLTP